MSKSAWVRKIHGVAVALLGVMTFTLICLAHPASAAKLYRYTDGSGAEHYTDNLNSLPPGARAIESVDSRVGADTGKGKPRPALAAKMDYGADEGRVAALRTILSLYRQTHTYSTADFFVCADMAIDVWNMARTQGFKVMIAAGHPSDNKATPPRFTHAWVVAEVAPSAWLAMETTGGGVVTGKENINYYRGHFFENPRDFKEYLDERRGINQQISDVKELEDKFAHVNGKYRQEVAEQQKLSTDLQQQCGDKRLAPAKFKQCKEMQQTVLAKTDACKELEGRVRQLSDTHADTRAKLEASMRLLNQPVRTVPPR